MRERSSLSLFWGEHLHLLSTQLQWLRRDSSQQIFDFFFSFFLQENKNFCWLINTSEKLQSPPVTPVWNSGISDGCFSPFFSAIKLMIRQQVV